MANNIIIAVDAMGGDNAPGEIVKGAVQALSTPGFKIVLVGREADVQAELAKHEYDKARIDICNANEVIGTDEVPTMAVKKKKDSSIVVGLNLLKADKAHAFVSAGSTGAVLTGATVIVGRINKIERPALATLLPCEKGYTFLIDCGANVDAKPSYLVQFAQMGSVYMEHIMGVTNPRVGLINIGAEREKGNALTKEAYELLEHSGVNFCGNVEARDITTQAADVLVCDAFVGNVVLKFAEGLSKSLMQMIKEEITRTTVSKLAALVLKNNFRSLKKRFDYSEVGGAPFLGLKKLVVKTHGSAEAKAVSAAVLQCEKFVEQDIVSKIEERLR